VLDEAIDALRVLLTDEVASFAGDRFAFEDLAVAPRPVQQPPPIWIGGSGRPALRRVAARGDGWIPQGTPLRDMPDQLGVIREHLGGRDPSALDLGAMAPPMYVGEPGWDVGRWTVTGTADRLAETVRAYADLGCSHVQVRPRSRTADELLDQIDAFGADVMPLL
jgi:alkanesulfonate monooxygenase SsuD/methylene tetrahydromethanopterin reductase-like flavin-dependent oxidoreductase (luciferase family)